VGQAPPWCGARRRRGDTSVMAAPRRVNPVEAALRRIAEDLTKAGTPWALIGGLAVSARAEPRTTRRAHPAPRVSSREIARGRVRPDHERAERWIGCRRTHGSPAPNRRDSQP
jgi:hypothetical protein